MEIKFFNRWGSEGIKIEDPGLRNCINLEPKLVPKTCGRNASTRFWKSRYSIVERLMNRLMVTGHKGKKHRLTSGHNTGKGVNVYNIVLRTFEIIEKQIKENPIKVFVKAVENAAPREEITTIEYGGARYPQAVECAPQRRIDITLRQMCQGAYSKSFGKKIKIHEALAREIIGAYKMDQASQAISKKLELERQSDSSR